MVGSAHLSLFTSEIWWRSAAKLFRSPRVRAGFLALAAYLAWLCSKWRQIQAILAVPRSDIGIFGNLQEILQTIRKLQLGNQVMFDAFTSFLLKKCAEHRKEGLFAVHVLHPLIPISRSILLVCDLEIVKQVLNPKSYGAFRKGYSYRLSRPLVGKGLLSVDDGPEWKLMRDLTQAGFKSPVLENAVRTVSEVTCSMMQRWRLVLKSAGPGGLDIYEESLRLTMDVLGLVAFSYDFKSVTAASKHEAKLYDAFQTILSTLGSRGLTNEIVKHIPSATNRTFDCATARLTAICQQLIDDRRSAMMDAQGQTASDILESFLAKDDQGQQKMSDMSILDCMKTILFAGHDTTASALTWALYLLATHPEWQGRLRKVLRDVGFSAKRGAELPQNFGYSRLEDLQELNAVVRETLRLYPSAGFTREAVQRTVLKNSAGKEYVVFPGTEIFFFPNVVQLDPAHVEDPSVFQPERWLHAPASLKQAWFPFSFGPRNCVGERLAFTELRVALALLTVSFRFTVVEGGAPDEPFQVLLLSMQPYGVRLSVEELTDSDR